MSYFSIQFSCLAYALGLQTSKMSAFASLAKLRFATMHGLCKGFALQGVIVHTIHRRCNGGGKQGVDRLFCISPEGYTVAVPLQSPCYPLPLRVAKPLQSYAYYITPYPFASSMHGVRLRCITRRGKGYKVARALQGHCYYVTQRGSA